MRRQFKPRASSTPFLARRSAGESRLAHSALHPDSRSDRRPSAQGALCGVGGPRRTRGARPRLSPPRGQVIGGRAGTWRAGGRTCRDRGRRREPPPPAGRKPAAAAAPRTRARGPRARGAGQELQRRAGLSPRAGGGRRDPGSGRRGRGGGSHPAAGSWPRAGRAARAAARPRKGYLLHGSLDGGVWGLGLLQQLQDLLKPLLVRFPLILHLGLLQIKPDTGRDGANVTPRAQARGLPAPSNLPFPSRTTPLLPRRLGPAWGAPKEVSDGETRGGTDPSSSAANVCCCCRRGRRAQGADQTESPRICNLAPRSAHGSPLGPSATQFSPTQPKWSSVQIITDLTTHQKLSSYPNPCKTPEEI